MRHNKIAGLRALDFRGSVGASEPARKGVPSELQGFDMVTTTGKMAGGLPEPSDTPDSGMVEEAIAMGISPADAQYFWGS